MASRRSVLRTQSIRWLLLSVVFVNVFPCSMAGAMEAESERLATVGEKPITVQDLKDALNGGENWKEVARDKKLEVLKELVRIQIFSREARSVGLERDEKLKKAIEGIANFYLAKEYVKRNVQDVVTVTNEEIKEYYEKHPEQFQSPEKFRLRQIFLYVAPEASIQEELKMKDLAENLRLRIQAGEDFSKLSSEFSTDPMLVEAGGDLGYLSRDAMAPEYHGVFSIGVGEVSPVMRGRYGYSIFKVEGRMPATLTSLEESKERIEKELRTEKEDKVFLELEKKLLEKYKVEIWPEKLRD